MCYCCLRTIWCPWQPQPTWHSGYSGYHRYRHRLPSTLRFKCAAHPFLRMNCKTPHIFHVIVCQPETGTGQVGGDDGGKGGGGVGAASR
ncbi:hypothetical protein ACLKA6_016595 [Drosophila palustris]